MSLGKQARVLSKAQIEAVLGYLSKTRHARRNRAIFLLSAKAGLRAKEIAHLTWKMIAEAQGDQGPVIRLEDRASKGKSGRIIPINAELYGALAELRSLSWVSAEFVISTERSPRTSAQAVVNMLCQWYRRLGLNGCSSHSGRRTFITNAARKISTVGGSLRDVQILAGHSNLRTTQRYIEAHEEAQKRVVELV
jgi:integrase